jgi:hypothetical protein
MSRTTLCVLTAGVLAAVSLSVMIVRQHVLGEEVRVPVGPGTWKVTLLVTGKSTGDVKLLTTTPLDFGRQHIFNEVCRSDELYDKPPDARHPSRRQIIWHQRAGVPNGPFRARYEFHCTTNVSRPSPGMTELGQTLSAAPAAGQYLQREPGVESDHPSIIALSRRLTDGIEHPEDQVEALYRHVATEIANEPSVGGQSLSAAECLKHGGGDAAAKSRLLLALCRNRDVPARLVTGLALTRDSKQSAHYWVEAWLREQWLPICPFGHHFGFVPRTYLVFGYGPTAIARGHNVQNLDYAFLVERTGLDAAEAARAAWPRRLLLTLSFHSLPPTEQRLVEFLLLLPVAALIVCIFRNVIGLPSFGTFAPALLGLSFRELHSMPGIIVFVSIVLTGWLLRRVLDRYHLLQVPRMAVMLSLVVLILITAIVTASHQSLPPTRYFSLFPMVILVGMIERFWTLETEDGTTSSFRTLLSTMFIVATISLVLSLRALVHVLFRYPELLGMIMAVQLLLGRYTGYRLSELYRFRDFLRTPPAPQFRLVSGE